MDEYKIITSYWFTNATILFMTRQEMACIGVVAVETGLHNPDRFEWKAYIGVSGGTDPHVDEQNIARLGSGLSPLVAHGFFPSLDIKSYKEG